MIGGLSSSLSLAQRTATKARATMDTMARQMATGQRVSSVKDDGAAWTRSNTMKSEASTAQWRASEARRYMPMVDLVATHHEEGITIQRDALRVLQQAQSSAPGSSQRRQLESAWQDIQARWGGNRLLHEALEGDHAGARTQGTPVGEWRYEPWRNGDAVLAPVQIPYSWWLSSNTGIGYNDPLYSPTLWAVDQNFLNASQANIATAITELSGSAAGLARTEPQVARISGAKRSLEQIEAKSLDDVDRLNTAIGSLTDADLGKASTARAQADTRQQLALQTIQQALSAYGSYAGGLLGNVQRTQRGVLA